MPALTPAIRQVTTRIGLVTTWAVLAAAVAGVLTWGSPGSRRAAPASRTIAIGTTATTATTATIAPADAPAGPVADADAFLSRYVDSDGRVVRRDQGGDTVSEGQAYGMLLAVAVGDASRFAAIWRWTSAHLQLEDGLLAWHWESGRLVDAMPASDADLDAAFALDLASRRFASPGYVAAAVRIATAVMALETVSTAAGPVLVAGPWATGPPGVVEPGYFSPVAFTDLGRLTSDPRWTQLAETSWSALSQMVTSGLPAEWASISSDGVTVPIPPPSGGQVAFGLGAARSVVWYEASCAASDRSLSLRAWRFLEGDAAARNFAISLSLRGEPLTSQVNPVMAVAQAAAAGAAGHPDSANRLLGSARATVARFPTYYGSAWLALGELVLESPSVGGCHPLQQR